jgi:hypothetical protein
MSPTFRFHRGALPPECVSPHTEMRRFIAAERGWVPNSDIGSHRSDEFSRRLGAPGWMGMTWPKRQGWRTHRCTLPEQRLKTGGDQPTGRGAV